MMITNQHTSRHPSLNIVFGEISLTTFSITQGWALLACYCISPEPRPCKKGGGSRHGATYLQHIRLHSDTIVTQYRDRHTEIISTSSARRKNLFM